MRSSRKVLRLVAVYAGPLMIALFYYCICAIFDVYDWGYPGTKFLCFAALFAAVSILSRSAAWRFTPSKFAARFHFGCALLLACGSLVFTGIQVATYIHHTPDVDMGVATIRAARDIFVDHVSPYRAAFGRSVPGGYGNPYGGYVYGPVLPVAYAAAIFGPTAFNLANVFFLAATLFFLTVLGRGSCETRLERATAGFFAIAMMLLPSRLCHEVFVRGTIDLFPPLLLLAASWCGFREFLFAAGALVGLSISAKLAPAIFFAVATFGMLRERRYLGGFLCGLTPLLFEVFADSEIFFKSTFRFHAEKGFDSTSIYSLLPGYVHPYVHAVPVLAALFFVARSWKRRRITEHAIVDFVLLMTIEEAFYLEVHLNHLLWFMPFFALIFAWYRNAPAVLFTRPETTQSMSGAQSV